MEPEDRFERLISSYSATSQVIYRRRVANFVEFCDENDLDSSKSESLFLYLDKLRNETEFDYHASTLWTISSVLNTWYEAVHGFKPYEKDPVLKRALKEWAKQDEVKKASTFERKDIIHFLTNYPDTNQGIVKKVAVILALYGLLRRNEVIQVTFEDVKFNVDGVIVSVYRQKQAGPKQKVDYIVTDDLSRAILTKYVHLFPDEQVSRFNFTIIQSKSNKIFRKMVGSYEELALMGKLQPQMLSESTKLEFGRERLHNFVAKIQNRSPLTACAAQRQHF